MNKGIPQQSTEQITHPLSPDEHGKKNIAIFVGIIMLCILIFLGCLYYLFFFHKTIRINRALSPTKFSETYPQAPTPTPTVVLAAVQKPLDCMIAVVNVVQNPPYKGDPPNQGMQYLEFDVSVACTGDKPGPVQGTFYYKDPSRQLFNAADVQDPASIYSNKKITIPGKTSLYATAFDPGKPAKDVYLIYQVKPKTTVLLLWQNPSVKGNQWQTLFNFIN